jgi:hypothetical protein
VVTVRAKVHVQSEDSFLVPIIVPDLNEVKSLARKLHVQGKPWHGEAFGWEAEYHPERPEPPLDSNMTFTPADFCIGESGVWFFSLMWEHGQDQEPVEFLDDRNIVAKLAYSFEYAA